MSRRLPLALLLVLVLALAFALLQGPPASASAPQTDPSAGSPAGPAARVMGIYNWTVNTVDTGPNVGQGASLAVAVRSPYTPSVSYYDSPNSALRVATYNGSAWVTRTVDSPGDTGQYSALALAPSAPYTPAIAYYSYNGVSGTLKYAAWNGITWLNRTVDYGNAGTYPSLAIDADLIPHASYYDFDGMDLKYFTVGGGHTPVDVVTVVDSAGDVGWYSDLALDTHDNPRISYYDATGKNLKHAAYSSGWTTETVDSAGNVGGYTSMDVDAQGFSHISYCQLDVNGEYCTAVKYAVDGVSGWVSQTIPTGSSEMLYTSLAIAPTAPYTPYIAYYDILRRSLMLATLGGSGWVTETVDTESAPGDAGTFPSIALAGDRMPRVAYNHLSADASGNRSLRYAMGATACATPLSGVTLQAPSSGITGVNYILTGTVVPALATSPFNYTWQTTGFAPQVFTSTSSVSSVTRNWSTVGPKTVTFTGANCGGIFTATQTIDITACRSPMAGLDVSGPVLGGPGKSYTFTASALPLDLTGPVTYTWQATGKPTTQIVAQTESAKSYAWMEAEIGRKGITVTAESCAGVLTATHSLEITATAYLPELTVPAISREGTLVHYSVSSNGMVAAPAGHQVAFYLDDVLQERVVITTTLVKYAVAAGEFVSPFGCAGATCVVRVCANDTHIFGEINDNNNCAQQTWSSDVTPPLFLKGPTVGNKAFDRVTVIWQTNEPTKLFLTYGRDDASGDLGTADAHYSTHHTVTLTMLEPSTAYHVKVKATDQAGNSKTSASKFFQTLAVADTPVQFGAVGIVPYDSGFYEFFTLRASTVQTANVRSLDFHLDGHDLGADYTPSPAYEVNLSPYALGYTRDTWYGQAHSVIIHGYNLSGTFNMLSTTVDAPARPSTQNELDIIEPHPNHTVWISGTAAMPGTILPVTVRAARLEWDCTWSGFAEPPEVPAGLDGVMCKDVDTNVTKMEVLLDGVSQGVYFPTAGVITHTFPVTLTGKGLGAHTLIAKASISVTSNTITWQTSKDFNIEVGAPSLNVFREIAREGNVLRVKLTLQNDGIGPALVDKLEDSIEGLQQVNVALPTYSISTSSSYFNGPERRHNRILIDFKLTGSEVVTIPAGSSTSVEYYAVPILHEGSVTPVIGVLPVKVTYKYDGQDVVRDFVRPGNTVRNPDGSEVPLAQGLADAMKESDYLLVTNPTRLYNYYDNAEVHALLSEMAYLALLKNGTLGYLKTYDAGWILDDLLDPGEGLHWTRALNPNFGLKNQGYVLLVGETEIVASWYVGHDYFTTYSTIPDEVYQSDLPYANISGKTARPELAVGRIVGDSAADLIIPIRASIGVAEGEFGYDWDRTRAVVISGRGDGVDSNFIPTVDIIEDVLNDEFPSVTKLHAKNIGTKDQVLAALKNALTMGQDVIFFRNHGNYDQWSDALGRYDISGLDFAGHKPFAFAAACLAGNYEMNDGDNITNNLLKYGIGAYIASTQLSERTTNDIASKAFYRDWSPGKAVGVSLNNAKIAVWDTDSAWESFDHEKLWAYEYNLYGDPKYGMTGGYSVAAASAPAVAPPATHFDVHVPAFEVARIDGKDHVTIPGGQVWLEPGQFQIPYYTVTYDYPAGQRVQAITLTARSGLVITAGLELPVVQPEMDCEGCGPLPPVDVFSGTWAISPTLQYEWAVEQSPNRGSRLMVKVFPFYYNTETTGVLFYQDYGFDLLVTQSAATIESLSTGKAVYDPGEKAAIGLLLKNTGAATDLVVQTTLLRGAAGEAAGHLPLTMLAAMTGTASLNMEWDTSTYGFGDYTLLVELLDAEGNLLDQATRHLGLGVVSGAVGNLAVSTTVFDPGENIDISMVFTNTGTVPLTGTAIILVDTGSSITPTATFTQPFGNLASGATLQVNKTWNTSGVAGGAYRVTGYASYYSQTSDPVAATINTRSRVFLPMLSRQ